MDDPRLTPARGDLAAKHLEGQVFVEDPLLGELQVAHLLEGVGSVGHQLPDEDFLFRVEGMDDDIEQLLDLGLEFEGLGSGSGGHVVKSQPAILTVPAKNQEGCAIAGQIR